MACQLLFYKDCEDKEKFLKNLRGKDGRKLLSENLTAFKNTVGSIIKQNRKKMVLLEIHQEQTTV